MSESLLNGFRALDLTDEKGFVCGKILAAMGVETIKIEAPGGDSARLVPPFLNDSAEPGKSLNWFAFNTDKRSITLNMETPEGKDLFRRLVKTADFVLESFPVGYMESLKLGYQELRRINQRIILTSITPFGRTGPYSNYKACELIVSAMGGVLENTGDPDRPPVKEALDSCCFHANVAAALGTMTAHYYREVSGEGQEVDISIQEVAASRRTIGLIGWEFDELLFKRSGPYNRFGRQSARWIWACKDGYVYWQLFGGLHGASANAALSRWIDEDGMENPLSEIDNWQEFDMSTMTEERLEVWENAISKFFLKHTKKEIVEEGLKRGTNTCVVQNSSDLAGHPQLRERNYWIDLEHEDLRLNFVYPRHFFLSDETENFVKRRAPLIGEDNDAVYRKEMGLSEAEISALKKSGVI
ncbi:MAG: CoA transferase [Deltaproteobacteria bacterium]|nr:CoA transferase [Deltaproteobacteria bacterium]